MERRYFVNRNGNGVAANFRRLAGPKVRNGNTFHPPRRCSRNGNGIDAPYTNNKEQIANNSHERNAVLLRYASARIKIRR